MVKMLTFKNVFVLKKRKQFKWVTVHPVKIGRLPNNQFLLYRKGLALYYSIGKRGFTWINFEDFGDYFFQINFR